MEVERGGLSITNSQQTALPITKAHFMIDKLVSCELVIVKTRPVLRRC